MKAPPNNIRAERAVLGAVLLRPKDALADVAIQADVFYQPAHRAIFDAMLTLDRAARAIDPLTVADELTRRDEMRKLEGGERYLVELLDAVPTAENVAHHARILTQKARQRRLIEFHREGLARAQEETDDPDQLQAETEQ